MPYQPQSGQSKAETPQNSRVSATTSRARANRLRALAFAFIVVALCFTAVRWGLRARPSDAPSAAPPPRIEVPPPAIDPNALLPHASEAQPTIATVSELAQPWSSKNFFYTNQKSAENIPALLIRLPIGSPTQPAGYWALAMKAPFGNCNLEYLKDLKKLRSDYGFLEAKHPMVGNPCSKTLFDPLKLTNVPGNVWVRGAIVQGSELRPPLGIEVNITGKEIQAVRME